MAVNALCAGCAGAWRGLSLLQGDDLQKEASSARFPCGTPAAPPYRTFGAGAVTWARV